MTAQPSLTTKFLSSLMTERASRRILAGVFALAMCGILMMGEFAMAATINGVTWGNVYTRTESSACPVGTVMVYAHYQSDHTILKYCQEISGPGLSFGGATGQIGESSICPDNTAMVHVWGAAGPVVQKICQTINGVQFLGSPSTIGQGSTCPAGQVMVHAYTNFFNGEFPQVVKQCMSISIPSSPTPPPAGSPTPSCSVSFSPSTVNNGETTVLTYTSSNVPVADANGDGVNDSWRVEIAPVDSENPPIGDIPMASMNQTHTVSVSPVKTGDYTCKVIEKVTPSSNIVRSQSSARITVNAAMCQVCPPSFAYDAGTNTCSCPTGKTMRASDGICVDSAGPGVGPTIATLAPVSGSGGGACVIGEPAAYTIYADDADSTAIFYEIDWNDGSPIQRYPATGYVTPGIARTVSHTWASASTYDVKVRVHDAEGNVSAWATYPITCPSAGNFDPTSNDGIPTISSFEVSPRLVRQGGKVNISWQADEAETCIVTGTNGFSYTAVGVGANHNASTQSNEINARTNFTLTCTSAGGSTTQGPIPVNIVPGWIES